MTYCTYRTSHPNGPFYEGKAQTSKVQDGSYIGSGTRFKAALLFPGYEKETWSTQILGEFESEEEAFLAEAALVSLESLADPMRLNMHVGGRNGKYQTHARLLKKISSEKRAINAKIKKDKANAKKVLEKEKIKLLKKKLKELK